VHQYVNFCGVTPLQYALADFMAEHPEHVEELPAFYQAKRDLFCDLLAPSRFSFTRVTGTYFQLVDYSQIRPDLNDVDMSLWMTREHGVATFRCRCSTRTHPKASAWCACALPNARRRCVRQRKNYA
jgi:methionine aminotransferase